MPAPVNAHTPVAFKSGTAYILDDKDTDAITNASSTLSFMRNKNFDLHAQKCDIVRDFFNEYTDYPVKSVQPSTGRTANKTFAEFWINELKSKGAGDLIIIYYDGIASENGERYTWSFKGSRKSEIDAHGFIAKLHTSGVDCILLLDCFVPTRFKDRNKWHQTEGNIEIIARGERMQDRLGRPVESSGGFAKVVCVGLAMFLLGIDDQFKGCHAARSIPEVLSREEEIDSNPLRLWQNKTLAGSSKVVKRIKVIPAEMRLSGKIEFFSMTIQGKGKKDRVASGGKKADPLGAESDCTAPEDDSDEDEGLGLDDDCGEYADVWNGEATNGGRGSSRDGQETDDNDIILW